MGANFSTAMSACAQICVVCEAWLFSGRPVVELTTTVLMTPMEGRTAAATDTEYVICTLAPTPRVPSWHVSCWPAKLHDANVWLPRMIMAADELGVNSTGSVSVRLTLKAMAGPLLVTNRSNTPDEPTQI